MQGLVLGSRLLQSSSCVSACSLLGPVRQMCMRRISRELAAEDDSHVGAPYIIYKAVLSDLDHST